MAEIDYSSFNNNILNILHFSQLKELTKLRDMYKGLRFINLFDQKYR